MSVIRNFLLDNVTPAPVVRENYSDLTLQPEDYESLIYPLVLSTINSSSGLTDIHYGYGELSAKISATSFSLNCNTLFANNVGEKLGITNISFPLYIYTRDVDLAQILIVGDGGANDSISIYNGLNVINLSSLNTTLSINVTGATVGNYIYIKVWPTYGDFAIPTNSDYNTTIPEDVRFISGSGWSIIAQYVPKGTTHILHGGTTRNYLTGTEVEDKPFDITNNGNTITIKNGSSTSTITNTELICNSREALNSLGEIVPLNKDNTPLLYKDFTIGKIGEGCVALSKLMIFDRDLPINTLKDCYNSLFNPPLPDVYYDINKQLLTNTRNYGTDYFIDFSGNNLHATVQNLDPVSPEWVFNPWKFYSDVIEATSPYDGVFHVTKLLENQEKSTVFFIILNDFVGFNSKISIFINKPAGKENASDATFSMGAGTWAETPFVQTLTEGVNVIDIPESSIFDSQYTNIARVVIPSDWWDQDENGNRIETNTDFYVVFFPVYDQSKAVGYPEYAVSDFSSNDWLVEPGTGNVSIINYYKVDTTECRYSYNFSNRVSTNLEYSTSNVFVIKPFKGRFKRHDGKYISVYIDLHGSRNGVGTLIKSFYYRNSTGEIIIDFPGAVVFTETSYTNSYVTIFLDPVGVYEQLPLETYFQFTKLHGVAGYTGAVIPSGPQYQTVIMELEVSDDVNDVVNTVNFYRNDNEATGADIALQMNGPATQAMGTELAFSKNNSGKVYINGVLNTTHTMSEYFHKRITVAVVGTNTETNNTQKYIGATSDGGESPFKLYKFVAFQQQLTEEQLEEVYERYNFYMGN